MPISYIIQQKLEKIKGLIKNIFQIQEIICKQKKAPRKRAWSFMNEYVF